MNKNINDSIIDSLMDEVSNEIQSRIPTQNLESRILRSIHTIESKPRFSWRAAPITVSVSIFILLAITIYCFYAPQSSLKMKIIRGQGAIHIDEKEQIAGANEFKLPIHSVITTLNNQMYAQLNQETAIILDRNTTIQYDENRQIRFKGGRLQYMHTNDTAPEWIIRTSIADVQALGTEYCVVLQNQKLLLDVFEGKVQVQTQSYRKEIQSGESFIVDRNQCVKREQFMNQKVWWNESVTIPWTQLLKRSKK